jgi:hypothetical protein
LERKFREDAEVIESEGGYFSSDDTIEVSNVRDGRKGEVMKQ